MTKSKKTIFVIIVVTFSALFLISNGCQNTQFSNQEREAYSSLENEVYDYINKLSSRIPESLKRTEQGYFESDQKTGNYISSKPLRAGFFDPEDFKRLTSNSFDVSQIQNSLSFSRVDPRVDKFLITAEEMITLSRGSESVVYLKQQDGWHKGSCKADFASSSENWQTCYDNVINSGVIVAADHVQRYLELADRLEKTYFTED